MVKDRCSTGGGLVLSFGLDAHEVFNFGWGFDAPADTLIDSLEIQRRFVAPYTVGLYGYYATLGSWPPQATGGDTIESCVTDTVPRCEVGTDAWTATPAADNPLRRAGLSARSLRLGLKCWVSLCLDAGAGDLRVHSARITLRDSQAPTVTDWLQLSEIGSVDGHRVKIVAADKGSGIQSVELVLDDTVAIREAAGNLASSCITPYVHPVPCPLEHDATLDFSTQGLSDGIHRAWVRTTDASGNVAITQPTAFVTRSGAIVDPGTAGPDQIPDALISSAVDRHAPGRVRVRAWFVGRSRLTDRTLAFGQETSIEGVASDVLGNPVAAAEVRARTRGQAGNVEPLATVRTDAKGRFTLKVGSGPTRTIEFTHALHSTDAPPAGVTVRVRAGVRLKTSTKRVRNGSHLKFSGRVLGEGAGRRLVTIYALSSGPRKRIPVETVRARADGRFAHTHEFTSIPGPVTYRFEARVPKQTGFPYLEGASKPVTVRGRP